jgi:hypothetical protein
VASAARERAAVRLEEIRRQLATANAMIPDAAASAASHRYRAHEQALRNKYLSGAAAKSALAEELGLTQDFLALGRP